MQRETRLQLFIKDFITAIRHYRAVIPFIRKHRLWEGWSNYGWVSKFVVLAGALVGLKFISIYNNWLDETEGMGMSIMALGGLIKDVATEGYDLFVMGSYKYLIVILLEIVIFHFARKTHQILSGEDADATLDAFLKAQIRMFKVVVYAWVLESVFSLLAGTFLAIVGFSLIKPLVIFLIQCYFLGFTFMDNYFEISELTIKESAKRTREYAGASLAIGFVVYVVMLLPVLGTVLGPLLGAVTATATMFELEGKEAISDMEFEPS